MTRRHCDTCIYDVHGFDRHGIKNCKSIVGICAGHNNLQGWKPIDIDGGDGFDPDLYMQRANVMPEEKEYMDFAGVI